MSVPPFRHGIPRPRPIPVHAANPPGAVGQTDPPVATCETTTGKSGKRGGLTKASKTLKIGIDWVWIAAIRH